jgi:hypothetical protein
MPTRAAVLALAVLLASIPVSAQWRNIPKDGIPAGPDGKPNMSAPAPRTASGRPDLSGIYQSSYRYFANLAADLGLDNVPMTAEARKIHTARATGLLGYEEPDAQPAAGRAEDHYGTGAFPDRSNRQARGAGVRGIQPVAAGSPRWA